MEAEKNPRQGPGEPVEAHARQRLPQRFHPLGRAAGPLRQQGVVDREQPQGADPAAREQRGDLRGKRRVVAGEDRDAERDAQVVAQRLDDRDSRGPPPAAAALCWTAPSRNRRGAGRPCAAAVLADRARGGGAPRSAATGSPKRSRWAEPRPRSAATIAASSSAVSRRRPRASGSAAPTPAGSRRRVQRTGAHESRQAGGEHQGGERREPQQRGDERRDTTPRRLCAGEEQPLGAEPREQRHAGHDYQQVLLRHAHVAEGRDQDAHHGVQRRVPPQREEQPEQAERSQTGDPRAYARTRAARGWTWRAAPRQAAAAPGRCRRGRRSC